MYDTLCDKQKTNDLYEEVNQVLADNINKALHVRRFLNEDPKIDDASTYFNRRNMPKLCVALNMETYSSDFFNKTLSAAAKIIQQSKKQSNVVVALIDISSMSILNLKLLNHSNK